jgi:ABC-type transport system involved in multi-copper enzyme maturation permease subunit
MIAIYARLTWLRLKRGRVAWVALALMLLPALGSAALLFHGDGGRDLYDNTLELYYYFLVPFVPALLLAPAIGDEVEGCTYTFLFARPAPRASMVLGKYLATTAGAAAAVAVALALAWGVAIVRPPPELGPEVTHFARTLAGALLGVAVFGAVAIFIGSIFTRHPLVASLVYLALVESGLGSAPLVINLGALSWHLRNVGELGQPSNYLFSLHVPVALSLAIVVAAAALALGGAALIVRRAEYR